MDLGKPNAHRRQNSGTFWSIARDRQFDLESENVHRSSEHPSPGRMIVLYVVSEEKKKTFNKTNNRVVADRIPGKEHVQAISDSLYDSGKTLLWHFEYLKFTAIQFPFL